MKIVRLLCLVVIASCGQGKANDTPTDPPAQQRPARPAFAPLWGTSVLEDVNADDAIVEVNLTAQYGTHEFEAGKSTQVFTYNGMTPGPTLQARAGDRIIVHFKNDLDEATTMHWHGLRITEAMDGNPMIQPPVQPGESFTYDFIAPDAGSFWYHPHMNTPQQMEKGLMGGIVIQEATPPVFDGERIFFTDDIRLTPAGDIASFAVSGMDIMHGRSGNTLLTNGTSASAALDVRAGTRERWRIFNGSNGRTMSLSLENAYFKVIGTDGGLLNEAYETQRIIVAIGQRYDLDVTFDGEPGSTATLTSHVLTVNSQDQVVEEPVVLQELHYTSDAAQPVRTVTFPAVEKLAQPITIRPEKTLELSAVNTAGVVKFTINGMSYPNDEHWTTEQLPMQIDIKNTLGMEHPFHIHGQFFKVIAPAERMRAEPGLKDTVLVDGLGHVTVMVYFNNPGNWMYHCHIAEHVEAGMMGHVHVLEQ